MGMCQYLHQSIVLLRSSCGTFVLPIGLSYIFVSWVYCEQVSFSVLEISAVYIRGKIGPRMVLCGTPLRSNENLIGCPIVPRWIFYHSRKLQFTKEDFPSSQNALVLLIDVEEKPCLKLWQNQSKLYLLVQHGPLTSYNHPTFRTRTSVFSKIFLSLCMILFKKNYLSAPLEQFCYKINFVSQNVFNRRVFFNFFSYPVPSSCSEVFSKEMIRKLSTKLQKNSPAEQPSFKNSVI